MVTTGGHDYPLGSRRVAVVLPRSHRWMGASLSTITSGLCDWIGVSMALANSSSWVLTSLRRSVRC